MSDARRGARRRSDTAPPRGFTEFVLGRSDQLFRTAVLLTRDSHSAQDLLQSALAKAWRSWDRIEGEPEAYVRRILLHEFLSAKRRRWSSEYATETMPEAPVHDRLRATPDDPAESVTTTGTLGDAVAQLPPRQRAVVVLRYFHDLTEVQTADALGIAVGTVKSQHAKALARLRISEHLADEDTDSLGATERRGHR